MSKPNVRIPLIEPIDGHDGPIRELVFREPDYDDYIACGGEPYTIGRSAEGALFSIEQPEVIWAYARACLVSPKDSLILEGQGPGSWRVAREVRKAILGFFQDPVVVSEPSQTSPTTSPSDSTNSSTPSAG